MIQKLFVKLSESRKIGQEFGCLYGIENFFSECIFRKKGKIGKKINKLQYDHIKKWLKRTYFDKLLTENENNIKSIKIEVVKELKRNFKDMKTQLEKRETKLIIKDKLENAFNLNTKIDKRFA